SPTDDRDVLGRSVVDDAALYRSVDGYVAVDCRKTEVPAGVCNELHSHRREATQGPRAVCNLRRLNQLATRLYRSTRSARQSRLQRKTNGQTDCALHAVWQFCDEKMR